MRYLLVVLAISFLSCSTITADETPLIKALIVAADTTLSLEDIEDVYLRYDTKNDAYALQLSFSKSGQEKLNSLLKNYPENKLSLSYGRNVIVGPLAIMIDKIDGPLTVVLKDKNIALELLQSFSK